jgi:hypothetical protein
MADIDSIIAGVGGNTRVEFPDFAKAFFDANKQRAEFDNRRAFKDGVPTDASGQPDFGAISKTFFQKGDINNGLAAAKLGLERQQMQFGQEQSGSISNFENGGPANLPPSPNRTASVAVAPPLNRGGTTPQGAPPQNSPQSAPQGGATVMQVLAAQGIPNSELQNASASIARQLGLADPNAPIDMQDPQVRNVLVPAVQQLKRMGIGQIAQPGQPQQQTIPPVMAQGGQPPQGMPSPVTDRVTTSAPPAQPSQTDKAIAFYSGIMSNPNSPKQNVELAKERLKALQNSVELTPGQKEYSQALLQGYKGTFEDWQNRADENTTQRDILNKSLLPRLDKSQETAAAARDDVSAIHRAREELDQAGGVFSGQFGEKQKFLAKVGAFFGVPDDGKIQNTEAYGAAIGSRVASMVKAFGSGTAISDGDRRFAAAMAGGEISLDERSMRRILDIGEKAARGKIDQHNSLADKIVKSNSALKDARDTYMVEAPGQYKKPELAAKPGASPTISSKADYDKLPVGSVFTRPDGKPWRKQ